MVEIIDLSQEIFAGMPVFPGLPDLKITVHQSHEQLDNVANSEIVSPAVNRLELGEHTGTHVDALNHMAREFRGQSIDTMPLRNCPREFQAGSFGPGSESPSTSSRFFVFF